jgi:hypothetical protein
LDFMILDMALLHALLNGLHYGVNITFICIRKPKNNVTHFIALLLQSGVKPLITLKYSCINYSSLLLLFHFFTVLPSIWQYILLNRLLPLYYCLGVCLWRNLRWNKARELQISRGIFLWRSSDRIFTNKDTTYLRICKWELWKSDSN